MERLHLDAVLFDMDGLMFDTERVALDAWLAVTRRMGAPLDRALVMRMIGRNNRDAAAILRDAVGDALDYAAASPSVYDEMNRMMAAGGPPIKEGLYPLLDAIAKRGLPAALVSGSPTAAVASYLAKTRLTDRFQAVLTGDMIARGKPAPDGYLLAAERLGAAPARCLVLEDAPAGIRAAFDAGMIPVMIPDLVPPDAETLRLLYCQCATLNDVLPLIG